MSDAATVGRAWFEQMWNRRDRDLLQRLMAEDVRGRLESGHIEGRETWVMQVYEPFLAAFPDIPSSAAANAPGAVIGSIDRAHSTTWRLDRSLDGKPL